ncbi:MAG: spore coat protein [Firmicutes bacterium]|nr:spore coat protein [Bacillota bacterium]
MQEKDMVLDVLSGTKASIANYAKVICETGDQKLRQTYQQMRDSDEKFQYDLYQVASQKGYYVDCPTANQQESSQLKSTLTQSSVSTQGAGPTPVMA